MFQKRRTPATSFLAFVSVALLTLGVLGVVLTACGSQPATKTASTSKPERHVQANLNIIVNQQGYQQDWPAYAPNTLAVPANSLVTITLHDYDLGLDSPLPKGTPFATVQGTIGGVAYLNGKPYAAWPQRKSPTPSPSLNCISMSLFPGLARSRIPSASPSASAKREPTSSSALIPVAPAQTASRGRWQPRAT